MPNPINSPPHDILGVGTPTVDHIIQVDHDFIIQVPGIKGGSSAIDYSTLQSLILQSGQTPASVIGGSTTNTVKGLVRLGRNCAFIGKIGPDHAGIRFQKELEELGITSYLLSGNLPTAQVLCLISPDAERTMRFFLGAGAELRPQDLKQTQFEGVKIVHIEGYLLHNPELILQVMKLAKRAGAKVSFDISSIEIARQYKSLLEDLILSYVDILFANEEEAMVLTGETPEKASEILKDMCEIAIVKMGSQGNFAATKERSIFQPAIFVNSLDTTGAGDLFASGFLHGYLSKLDIETCSLYGAQVASEVVQMIGADIPHELWQTIKKKM